MAYSMFVICALLMGLLIYHCLPEVERSDLPALDALMQRLQDGVVQIAEVATEVPSPFAASLLFGYVAEFMYESDAPLAERRTSVLSLESGLLSDLFGQVDLSELFDTAVVDRVDTDGTLRPPPCAVQHRPSRKPLRPRRCHGGRSACTVGRTGQAP